jgi:predicted methyltransferase
MTINIIRAAILRLAVLFAVCFSAAAVAQDFSAIISAPDRTDADRQADKRRDPMKLLEFVGPRPGWRVLDMAVGAGYSTELMARAVQPGGKVIAQDDRASEKFSARMKTPIMSSVEAFVTPFDDLSNPAFRDFDLETFLFGYHDTTYLPVDRAKMNKALFDVLKPGGLLVVADHSAKPEDGTTVGKTLHRISEKSVRAEIEAAGFVFVADADFNRHPEDERTNAIFRNPTPVDGFVLKFRKP